MPKFKCFIEYEGTRYAGWQVQKGEKTIQGAFFDVFKDIFGELKFEFYGAGRTDAGVHAFSQIAHLEVDTRMNPDQLFYAINDRLPFDVCLLEIEHVHPRFHARFDATARSYVYLISTRRSAFTKNNVWWIKDKLDIKKMQDAASIMTGLKDFRSFTEQTPEEGSTKVEIKWVDIHQKHEMIGIHIVGSHFLWKMVRRMAGILVEVGRGKLTIEAVESLFTNESNLPAQYTAPASGLYLDKVYYNNNIPSRGAHVVPQILRLR